MKARLAAILLIILSHTINGMAQWSIVRNFANAEYGGGTQTWGIAQLDDERILFANKLGLLIFDGNAWQTHTVKNESSLYSIYYDEATQRIYAGAQNEYGYFYFDDYGVLQYQILSTDLPANASNFGEIWRIHRIKTDIIFEAKHSIFILKENGKTDILNIPYRIEHCAEINGVLYIACREQVYIVKGQTVSPLPNAESIKGEIVRAILPFSSHKRTGVLFVTADSGLWLYDGKKMSPYNIDRDIPAPNGIEITQSLMSAQVFCAAVCKEYIAFGTVRNGVMLKSLTNGNVFHSNTSSGMQNNTVLSLMFDNDKNIWLGLDNGIDYMVLNTPIRNLLSSDDVNHLGTGYSSLIDGNTLYLGTNQGLFYIDLTQEPIHREARQVSGFNGQVWILRKIGDKVLCGADAGAFVVKGHHAEHIPGLQGTWDFKTINNHPDLILTCDYMGFAILTRSQRSIEFGWRIDGTDLSSNLFEQDADGSLWVNHWQKGIYRLTPTQDWHHISNIEYFYSGNCLPSNGDNLICKIDGKVYASSTDCFRHYDTRTHLLIKDEPLTSVFNPAGKVIRVKQLPSGDLWGLCNVSIYYARRQRDGSFTTDSISTRRFIHQLQIELGDLGYFNENNTIFNCEKGFYVINNSLHTPERTKKILIRSVVSTNAPDSVLFSSRASISKHLDLPHSLNSIRIEFVQPEYSGKNNVEYSYRLQGFDKQWSPRQPSCTKEYTKLGKGVYTFRVRAYNLATGQEQETALKIHILPAWYETWWAYTIYVLLSIVCIYYLFLYLKKRADRELSRAQAEQERQLREQQAMFEIEENKRQKELMRLRNSQLEVELKHKSSELADSIMNLVRKNDMLQELDSQMEELSESVKHEERRSAVSKKIGDIRRGIRMNMNDDDNWEKFRENFNMVYDNFMHQLTTHFPDLKKNDLKLCAYLRMGLSSKEMASLLNTSVRSIETARYRLRKKLNLGQGENLTSFIQRIQSEQKTDDAGNLD